MYLRSQTKQRYALTHTMQLRDVWAAESSKQGGTGRIDVLSWLSRATLDIIGLAGQYCSCDSTKESIFTSLYLRLQLQVQRFVR